MRVQIAGLDLPLAPVKDLIAVADEAFEFERAQLLADLDAAGVEPESRAERLRELSMRKGTGALLIMATFRIETATRIVRSQLQRASAIATIDVDAILGGLRHEEVTALAQRFMGYREKDSADPQTAAVSK